MKELISVIIPVYNVEKYLQECIDSVLNQSYQNLEIILVDDGSTDSSGIICDEYAKRDDRVKIIHQENQGLSGARNTGFSKAIGEYVYFLDSDDWIVPETIEELYKKAENEKSDFVFFEALSFEDGEPEVITANGYSYKNEYETNKGVYILSELQNNKEYHSAVPLLFIKRKFMKNSLVCFEQGILYEDMLFTYELFCKAEKVAQLKKPLYRRRYRCDSIMTSKKTKKNFVSAYKVYEKVREVSYKMQMENEAFAVQYICRCAFNVFNYYKSLEKEEKKDCRNIYHEFKQEIWKNNAYGNRALRMRCFGYAAWVLYKIFERLFITGMKG